MCDEVRQWRYRHREIALTSLFLPRARTRYLRMCASVHTILHKKTREGVEETTIVGVGTDTGKLVKSGVMKQDQIIRQNIGIDISKSSFEACYTTIDINGKVRHRASRKFANTQEGFEHFLDWADKVSLPQMQLYFTMEATGVYYEGLAYFLKEKGKRVSVILPNMVKKYAGSLNCKSKTDKIDARVLGQMGVERVLPEWKLSSPIFRKLRKLTRERTRLVEVQSKLKNFLEAEKRSGEPNYATIKRLEEHIEYVSAQIKEVEQEIEAMLKQDEDLRKRLGYVKTIPGVGIITFAVIVSETQGFDNFRNMKQLYSYAGYDVQQVESGKYKGRSRISKKGNKYIRRALYMPAMTAIRCSETFKRFYERIKARKGSSMMALTAVQRKLLGLIYTLYRKQVQFVENYEMQKTSDYAPELLQNNTEHENVSSSCSEKQKEKSGEGNQTPTTQDRQGNTLPSFSNAKLRNKNHNANDGNNINNIYMGT